MFTSSIFMKTNKLAEEGKRKSVKKSVTWCGVTCNVSSSSSQLFHVMIVKIRVTQKNNSFLYYYFLFILLKIIQRKQHGNTYNRLYIYIYVYPVYRGETRHYFIKGKRIIIVYEAFIVVAVIYFIFLVQHIKGHLIINNK